MNLVGIKSSVGTQFGPWRSISSLVLCFFFFNLLSGELAGHKDVVSSFSFCQLAAQSHLCVSSSNDGTVRFWDANDKVLIREHTGHRVSVTLPIPMSFYYFLFFFPFVCFCNKITAFAKLFISFEDWGWKHQQIQISRVQQATQSFFFSFFLFYKHLAFCFTFMDSSAEEVQSVCDRSGG